MAYPVACCSANNILCNVLFCGLLFYCNGLFGGLHSLWCVVQWIAFFLMLFSGLHSLWCCSVDCILCDVLCVLIILMSLFGWQDIVICQTCVCCILQGVLLSGLHALWCVVQLIASRSPSPTWTLRAPRAVTTTTWGCSVEMTPMPQSWVATAAWLFPRPSHPQAPASFSSSCRTQSRRKQASALCTHCLLYTSDAADES